MSRLLLHSRELRDHGNESRHLGLKTSLRTSAKNLVKLVATPSYDDKRKLENEVRSNRRFELLMIARGINLNEQPEDDAY